jgi:flagellar basal-body rod modification protein FlgD
MISPTYTGEIYDSSTANTTRTTGVQSGMGQEAFLKMFMAQMTNQNPLDPMDNTEFTAQLAQFSSLEQLTAMNEKLNGLSSLQTAFQEVQVASYLGKEILAYGNQMPVTDGQAGSTYFNLAAPAEVRIIVTNEDGQTVRDEDLGAMGIGEQEWTWDGLTSYGQAAPDGVYKINILATDSDGNAVKINSQYVSGIVTGFQWDANGNLQLLGSGSAISLSDVVAVRVPKSGNNDSSATDTSSSESTEDGDGLSALLQGLVNLGASAAALL